MTFFYQASRQLIREILCALIVIVEVIRPSRIGLLDGIAVGRSKGNEGRGVHKFWHTGLGASPHDRFQRLDIHFIELRPVTHPHLNKRRNMHKRILPGQRGLIGIDVFNASLREFHIFRKA